MKTYVYVYVRVCTRRSTYKRHAIFKIEMHALCPILEKYRCLGFWLSVLPTNLGQKKRVPSGKPPKTKIAIWGIQPLVKTGQN